MEASSYTVVLRERLGNDGFDALEEMMRVGQANLLTVSHFERRLGEELAALRLSITQSEGALRLEIREGLAALRQEMTQGDAGLRQEMTEGHASLRQEMTEGHAALRREMTEGHAALRREMTEGHAALRQEIAQGDAGLRLEIAGLRQDILAGRFELVKWSFVFWVGQVVSVAGIVGLMLRFMQP